jgi:heme exporter protein D
VSEHWGFIIAAYALSALVVAGLVLATALDHRAQCRALSALEARGLRRRSDTGGAA